MSGLPVFPKLDVIPADNPLVETINFKNIGVSFGKEAREIRKQQWEYSKRDITLKYTWISTADALTLWEFYIARGGSFEGFKYFHPFVNIYENEFVTVCNGWEYVFDLPVVNSTERTVYKNDVFVDPSEYLFGAEQGANGEDAIGFYVIPEIGDIITIDFTGQLVQRCRFDSDTQNFETFHEHLSTVGIKMKGLLLSEQFGAPTVTTTTTTSTTTTTT